MAGKICKKKYPKLIYASASGFGQTGPLKELPAYDMVVQGMGGSNECNWSTKL